ncbi:MAG: hypothetical protein BGO11_11845 [Solirubrobacterales bacterium 70-9]|nr:MAG: hypothetical protein BGO11_11845 [Solirubrobacterales bacterium 70-9]
MFNSLKTKLLLFGALISAFMVGLVGDAFATETAVEYGKVTEGASTQISAAVPIALGVVGLFVGIMIAYKLLRRIVRA